MTKEGIMSLRVSSNRTSVAQRSVRDNGLCHSSWRTNVVTKPDKRFYSRLWPLSVCIAMWLVVGRAVADDRSVLFPKAPRNALNASATFKDRADAIVTVNACGRELDYLNIRAAMVGGDLGRQGEDMISILIAKTEWLRSGRRFADPCESTIQFPVADEASWSKTKSPTHCAVEKGRVVEGANVTVSLSVDSVCMRRQVNDAIRAMLKDERMGSSGVPCIESLHFSSNGEWDTNVRELVRVLYMGRNVVLSNRQPLLEPETIHAMYTNLLAARGSLGPASYNAVAGCGDAGDELGTPEDTADRHDWGNELLNGTTDVLMWLFEFLVKSGARSLQVAGATVIWPFMVASGNDPTAMFVDAPEIPETENHRLQIESSRYLTNVDLIERLDVEGYDHADDIRDENKEVREWLLRRLQNIAAHDFIEYNAKPYTRYSLESITNLYDFGDDELKTAAHIVLDLSGAKFAVGSNRGRRVVPYRRLVEHEGITPDKAETHLYNYQFGADHEVARAIVLNGQTQLLEVTREVELNGQKQQVQQGELRRQEIGNLVNTAVSSYRLPQAVVDIAVDRVQPLSQRVGHDGVEQFEQSPAFTISAGGMHTPAPYSTLGFSKSNDEGIAMPTVIIPTIAGLDVGNLFGFYGESDGRDRGTNLCVWKGFACGLRPKLPDLFARCKTVTSISTGTTVFFNSKKCFPDVAGPHFYLAARLIDCNGFPCKNGMQWGLMEIVEAPDAKEQDDSAFDLFRTQRGLALEASQVNIAGSGVYVAANGDRIGYRFEPLTGAAKVITVNDTSVEFIGGGGNFSSGGDPLRSSPINSDGRGRATIVSPTGARVDIDFSSWPHPKRSP
jgi:hypothetical protein